jgi:uncharacterized protein
MLLEGSRLRLILDSNVWFQFAYNPKGAIGQRILQMAGSSQFEILTTTRLESELSAILNRPRHRARISAGQILKLWEVYRSGTTIDSFTEVRACGDPKDDFLLALAVDGQADFLLTSDEDLLSMSSFGATRICTLGAFLAEQVIY